MLLTRSQIWCCNQICCSGAFCIHILVGQLRTLAPAGFTQARCWRRQGCMRRVRALL